MAGGPLVHAVCCPACGGRCCKVVDTRPSRGTTRRRRQCAMCQFRFTTYEIPDHLVEQTTATILVSRVGFNAGELETFQRVYDAPEVLAWVTLFLTLGLMNCCKSTTHEETDITDEEDTRGATGQQEGATRTARQRAESAAGGPHR